MYLAASKRTLVCFHSLSGGESHLIFLQLCRLYQLEQSFSEILFVEREKIDFEVKKFSLKFWLNFPELFPLLLNEGSHCRKVLGVFTELLHKKAHIRLMGAHEGDGCCSCRHEVDVSQSLTLSLQY